MKTFGLSLAVSLLLGLTAPASSWGAGPGGGAGGHGGGFGGAGGHVGGIGGGGLNPTGGGIGELNPAGGGERLGPVGGLRHIDPLDRENLSDHGGKLDHERGFFRDRERERFGYPVCFASPYCPSPVSPCVWEDGHWAGQPGYADEGAPAVYGAWVPPGCY